MSFNSEEKTKIFFFGEIISWIEVGVSKQNQIFVFHIIGFGLIWPEGESYVFKMMAFDIDLKKFAKEEYRRKKNCFVQLVIIS